MIRPKIRITITQRNDVIPTRTAVLILNFATSVETSESWRNLTDTAKITIPKSVVIHKADGGLFDLSGKGKPIMGPIGNQPPFIMRGDRVKIEACYWYYNEQGEEQIPPYTTLFEGYISKVKVKIPIEIECEDSMYILKQTQAPNKVFKGTVEDMVKELIAPLGMALVQHPEGITTNVGVFRVENETIAQVLDRLRRDYKIECWFRGTNLHVSSIVYFPDEHNQTPPIFEFQSNIISDSLEYTRTDDVILGANCYSVRKTELTTTTTDGKKKTTRKRLSAFVGKPGGEIRTFYFWDVATEAELKKKGEERLRRFFFEGYKGSITTFGEPYVKHGDTIILRDRVLPEREGEYYVKAVRRKFGVDTGYRQEIELDIRADVFTASERSTGL